MKTIDASSKTEIVSARRRSLLRDVRGAADYVAQIVLIVALALGGVTAVGMLKNAIQEKADTTGKAIKGIK